MKNVTKSLSFVLLFTFVTIPGVGLAQTDSIYVDIQGDTATIYHTQTYRNCGALFNMDVQMADNHITITEIDTGASADCMCYFDLSVTIAPLDPGYYTADIYSLELWGDTLYWGSTSFTIEGNWDRDWTIIDEYQSECYDIVIPTTWYVSTTGSDETGDGSEDNPFATIQYVLYIATEGDIVLVASGTYVENINWPATNGIKLMGSGEDDCIIDGNQSGSVIQFSSSNIDTTTFISGFTIQNGLASVGGGISCNYYSSPYFENVTITNNSAGSVGGGISCNHYSGPIFSNVTITNNSVTGEWSAGGGISCWDNSSPSLENVTISGNSSEYGGGIHCNSASPSLSNVTIKNNSVAGHFSEGGGICCWESSPSLVNVTISGNSAYYFGGGISCDYSSPTLTNVTISGNSANNGGGIYCLINSSPNLVNVTISSNTAGLYGGGIYCESNSSPSLVNCILWNDSPQEIYFNEDFDPNTIMIAYSDIQGGEEAIVTNNNGTVNWVEGNINADPMFTNPDGFDFTLQSYSPCIDAGTAFFVWEGDTLVDLTSDEYVSIAPDMGAFEYFGETLAQNINLSTGWNIFSSYVTPDDLDMLSIVQPLIDAGTLDKVLDESGNAILYFMGNWVNNIGDLANTEGYYIKVNDDVALTIEGTAVELPFEIDLTSGWNIMGYPTDVAQDGLNVVQPLINANELNKVLDETGNAIIYFFGEWVNNIGDFEAGEGYYTKVNTNTSLTISEPVLARIKTATVEDKTEKTSLSHFSPVFTGNPFMPMGVYLVGEEFANLDLEEGDEVSVFDGELCVGATVVEGVISIANPLIIITSMDDEIGMPGFSEGNPISYKIWDVSKNRELSVDEVTNYDPATGNELNTEPTFERLGTIAVSFKSYAGGVIEPMIPETFALHQNYPNPFNPVTTIRYDLPEQSFVTIVIYDLLGRAVRQLVNSTRDAGYKSVVWDSKDEFGRIMSAGIYLYQIQVRQKDGGQALQNNGGQAGNFVQTRKMLLLK